MSKTEFYVGMHITFPRAYSIDPKARLKGRHGNEAYPLYDLETRITAPDDAGRGTVVGQRNYIMSDWHRDDDDDDDGSYWITGKRRDMLIVSIGLRREFVLVKPEDASPEVSDE